MQTTKVLFLLGLVAALITPTPTYGARDTEEQVKAREALRNKMTELDATSTPKPAAATAPAPTQPDQPAPPAPAPAAVAPAPAVSHPGSSFFAPVPEAVENPNTSRAREALRQQMSAGPNTPGVAVVITKPGKSDRKPVFTEPVLTPSPKIVVPLPPLTGSKEAQLAELLQRYTTDQITPKEYHTQRAAIMAAP